MNGYCSECDKQIEFTESHIIKDACKDGKVAIYLECPWCEEKELITKVDIKNPS